MACLIAAVARGSVAEAMGITAGDMIESIAGEPVIDQIDYQALTAAVQFPLEIRKPNGSLLRLHIHKQETEPLGISLDQGIVARPRECRNKCIFCFIDQMPPNMRDTLYVKDDDWRLSLMMGNYVTLTNIDEKEFGRILARKASPLTSGAEAKP